MTDRRLRDLTASSALAGGELFYSDNNVNDVKVTASQINTFTNISHPWIDIRDHGALTGGNNITTMLQATLNSISTAAFYKTIFIPDFGFTVVQDALTIPTPTAGSGWTFIYCPAGVTLTETMSLPTGTTVTGNPFGSNDRTNYPGSWGPAGTSFFAGSGTGVIGAGEPMMLIDNCGGIRLENISLNPFDSCSVGLRINTSANVKCCRCDFRGGNSTTGGFAAFANKQPGLEVIGSFWTDFDDCSFYQSDGVSPSVWHHSIGATGGQFGGDIGGGLTNFTNILTANGAFKIGPFPNGSGNNGGFIINKWVSESLQTDNDMLMIDTTTGGNVHSIHVTDAEMADPVGAVTFLRYNGRQNNSTINGIFLDNCCASVNSNSSGLISALSHINMSAGPQATLFNRGVFSHLDQIMDWGADWGSLVDKRLVCAPRTCQWNPGWGFVRDISQDGSGWTQDGIVSLTPGILAPDGTLNAVQVVGNSLLDNVKFDTGGPATFAIGDWFVGGVWMQGVGASIVGQGNDGVHGFPGVDIFYGSGNDGTFDGSLYVDWTLPDTGINDGAWKWCGGATKIKTFGASGAVGTFQFFCQVNSGTFNIFNPSLFYIPDGTVPDGDIINFARSLKGGWPPNALAGDVAILGHQRISAGAIRTPLSAEKTIASGVITATGGYHTVDTQSDAASDDLDTINGGKDGMRLVLRAADSARTVVVKDGTGNIQCAGDFSLDNTQDTIELIFANDQSAWLEIGRSDNGA